MRNFQRRNTFITAATCIALSGGATMAQVPGVAPRAQHVWIEAEDLAPIAGANFSFFKAERQSKGSWAMSGPGVAAEWTQGGESEFLSIAIRADEPAGTAAGRDIEIPAAGQYFLWVRYADYRNAREEFGVRVVQNGKSSEHRMGIIPVVDELDPMKLYWDWSFGWASARLALQKGAARVELFSTGPTEARRQVDCLCLTTDANYRPSGRQKPDFSAWQTLRNFEIAPAAVAELLPLQQSMAPRPAWQWNVREEWLSQLAKAAGERIEAPFRLDPSLLPAFTAAFAGKQPPIYSHALSGPVPHISDYPAAFKTGSTFLQWLERHPEKKFSILLNYGEPRWPEGTTQADKQAAHANLQRFKDRFLGFIAGENISYASPDGEVMARRVRAAKSRAEVLAILREMYTAATVAKFSGYYGQPVTAKQAWADVISCLSVEMEPFAHALANWGERRLGHESSGNNPVVASKLAFLRGAARQFNTGLFNYQSMNLGDSATMFSREDFFYPASSRYILDNQYDAWAGAGVNWFLKDYLLWHAAGVDAFYNEQGVDMFWKPGGNSAGDDFPLQLSPKGKVAEAVQKLVAAHPRGAQYTPVAFLLDEAHGWAQSGYYPTAFNLDPSWNPKVLARGRHEASIRGWMDVAYYPAPETQNEPASGVRQSYVNGVFGDIFDVIVSAPGKAATLNNYRVVVAAGEVTLAADWGTALRSWMQNGGTLVVSADQLSGAGAATLGLPQWGEMREANSFIWSATKATIGAEVFRYSSHTAVAGNKVLASAPDGTPLCIEQKIGKGRLIAVSIPLGLGINERPTPLSGLILRHVTTGLLPVTVNGDVQWALNRLENGGWLVTIFNNSGILKPQHGVLPTDHSKAQTVTIRSAYPVKSSQEWMTEDKPQWSSGSGNREQWNTQITVPAGAPRIIEMRP